MLNVNRYFFLTQEEDDDQATNQTVPTPPVEATKSVAVASSSPVQTKQESMGGASESISQGIVDSSTLDISLLNVANAAKSAFPIDSVRRHDYVSRLSFSSTAAEVAISSDKTYSDNGKSTAVPPSQSNSTRSNSLKHSSVRCSDKNDKKHIHGSQTPYSIEKVEATVSAIKVIKITFRNSGRVWPKLKIILSLFYSRQF